MSIQMQQLFKQHHIQKLQNHQISSKQDKIKLSNLMQDQINEKCSNKQKCETHKEESPSQRFGNLNPKPCQNIQQQNFTQQSNVMSLQNKRNINKDQFLEKNNNFNRQRSQSPNSLINLSQINDIQLQRRPASFADEASYKQKSTQKSPKPYELQESIVTSTQDNQKSKIHIEQKLKNNYQQLGSFCSTKQYQQGCPLNQQTHSSTNSISYNNNNNKQNFIKKQENNSNRTPTKLTKTTLNTEFSKCKSVKEDQCNKAITFHQDRENDQKVLNIGTPSTYLHSKFSIEQQSVDESLGNKFQQGKILCQYSPLIGSNDNLENVLPIKTCENHRNKKAKYKVEDFTKSIYLCSQCAIDAASQGKVVQEIKQLKIKSQVSQIPTFESKIIDFNKNVNQCDMQFKEGQLNGFLRKLDVSQTLRLDLQGQIKHKVETIANWYEIQIRKCEEFKVELQNILNDISKYCIAQLKMQQQESLKQIQILLFVLQQHQQEADNIKQDIEDNWNAVLKTIKMEPFQKIMDNHQLELMKMDEFTQSLHSITIELKQFIKPDIKPIVALIASSYQLHDERQLLIQNSQSKNQPKNTQLMMSTVKQIDHLDIPIQQSKMQQKVKTNFVSGVKTQPEMSEERQCNSSQKFNVDNIVQKSEQKQQQQKNNNLYISFENKDLFMNTIEQEVKVKKNLYEETNQLQLIESQNYLENQMSDQNSPKSTPHSPASGQMKQSIQRTGIKADEVSQVCSEANQKQKTTFRKLFDNTDDIQTVEMINEESIVLQEQNDRIQQKQNKISNNQLNNQKFFQGSNDLSQYMMYETIDLKRNDLENIKLVQYLQDTQTCKKDIEKSSQMIDSVKQVNQWDVQQNMRQCGKEDHLDTQKILNFRKHFSDLNKIVNPQVSKQLNSNVEFGQEENENSLFSSPQFKDQDILNISEKCCISN